jgi:site-specific DNA-cytosine methylase
MTKKKKRQLTAIGITSGIGSMLVGAKQLGFNILGNIEWRKYYHRKDEEGQNTFRKYFHAPLYSSTEQMVPEDVERMSNADIAFGHPECGNFSTMSASVQRKEGETLLEMRNKPGDIPLFVDLIKKLKPRYFVQDNLPKSLMGYPIERWAKELPEYDLFPEWISNAGYGNVQKFRKRFFMIGALKSENFIFHPEEHDYPLNLEDVIADLPELNHDEHNLDLNMNKGAGIFGPETMTWAQYRDWMLENKEGITIPYLAKDGTWKKHIGWRKGFKNGYVPVLTGGCPIANPFTGLPFSIRERCRIQGLPDDFEIIGTIYKEDGTWAHNRNNSVIRQTGKCMPVQFCKYITKQIKDNLEDKIKGMPEPKRVLNHNPLINEAKKWYCKNVGYEYQLAVCTQCWIKNCEIKEETQK